MVIPVCLIEIEQYAYEPLREHELGSDEGESVEKNRVCRNVEWRQCNHSPDESTGLFVVLSWTRCTINCKVDSFHQFSLKKFGVKILKIILSSRL